MAPVKCGECLLELEDVEALSKHYQDESSHESLSSFKCAYCGKRLLHKRTLIRHISSYHVSSTGGAGTNRSDLTNELGQHRPLVHSSLHEENIEAGTSEDNNETGGEDNDFTEDIPISLQETVDNAAVNVLVNLRSTASLTGKAIERFEKGCSDMLNHFCSSLKSNLITKLGEKGMAKEDIDAVLSEVQVEDPFRHLKSIDDQLNYFRKKFGLVIPDEKYLDHRTDMRLDPKLNAYVPCQVNETFQYVTIIGTLKAVLADKKTRDLIFKDIVSKPGVMTSYVDGDHFKNHPFLQKHKGVLQILLYYDELETANALGSKTIIHKLGAFFFQILNLPAEQLSKMWSIHLLNLVNADDMKKPGAFNKVLTPFIQEMKKLSSDEGVHVTIDNEDVTMRAVLVALTADTLAAHELCGFLGPGARHFCRKCMVSRAQVRANANAMGMPRTVELHEYHLQQAARGKRHRTMTGVKGPCPLDSIPFFSCVENVVFDAFHDLLEGVVPLVLKLVLREYIVVRKYFTVKDLNGNISSFSYGIPDSKNKPSPNFTYDMLKKKKGNLKQTGSQMWCLARCLPFLISSFLPEEVDSHMRLLFILQEIMQIVFSFEIASNDDELLEQLIFDHNDLFFDLFIEPEEAEDDDFEEEDDAEPAVDEPDEVDGAQEDGAQVDVEEGNGVEGENTNPFVVYITNKLHHLKHYPGMIRKYANPVRIWCAKFEARLKIFRQHSAVCCNFKNPPKTMSKMFQLSNLKSIKSDLRDDNVEHTKEISLLVKDSIYCEFLRGENLQDEDVISFVKSATVNGEEYRSGLFVCLPGSSREQPKFALINDVVVVDETSVILIVRPWKTLERSAKYNTFVVCPEGNTEVR